MSNVGLFIDGLGFDIAGVAAVLAAEARVDRESEPYTPADFESSPWIWQDG